MARKSKNIETQDEQAFEAEAGTEAPQTLDQDMGKRRGMVDRMLRPSTGMKQGVWAGKDHYKCPNCNQSTFDPAIAKKHRC